MARILITCDCEDSDVIAEAITKYGRRDVYWAKDNTVPNKHKAEKLGIDSRLNLVGDDADHDLYDEVIGCKVESKPKKSAPKSKKNLAKEVEAVVDEQSE